MPQAEPEEKPEVEAIEAQAEAGIVVAEPMVDAEEISRQYVQSITPAKKDVVVGNTWCPLCGAVYGPEERCWELGLE